MYILWQNVEHSHSTPSAKEKTAIDFTNNKNNLLFAGIDYSAVFFVGETVILIFCLFPTMQKCANIKFCPTDIVVFFAKNKLLQTNL